MEDLIKRLLQLHTDADDELKRWMNHYEEVAKYFLPMKDNVYGADTSGDRKHNFLFDSTSVHSNELLAAMLHTLLSSPNQEFFELTTGDAVLDRSDEVRAWRQSVARILHTVLGGSNYHSQCHEAFLDAGAFGMLVLRQEQDDNDVIRYAAEPCYKFSFLENANGAIDTTFRKFHYTNQQILEKFPDVEYDPDTLKKMQEKPLEKQEILHAVMPREKFDFTKKNKKNKKFASYYILLSKKLLLEEGGFELNPYIVTRWHVVSGETRGRGPAMKALPDARTLNALQKTALKVAQKIADPVYLLPDDGVMRPFKTAPGSINYYRGSMKDAITTLDNHARPDFIESISENIRERIKKAFYVDQILLREGPQMTATEVMQRAEEQLRMLGPVQGRFSNEYLRPLIEGVYHWADKAGLIPKEPLELAGRSLGVRFKSTMARSQNMIEIENLNRMVGVLAPFLQIAPEIIDMLSPEDILQHILELHNVPQEFKRNAAEVEAIRQESSEYAMAQQEQRQQMQQAEVNKTEAEALGQLM